MIRWLFFAPGDWLGTRFNARERRAIAAWLMIAFVVATPLTWPFRSYVSLVWLLSEVALVVGMWGVVSAETPVESE